MQIQDFGNNWDIAVTILNALLVALLLLLLVRLFLWVIRRFVGEANYTSLTTMLALTGAIFAIYQFNAGLADKTQERARTLAFAVALSNDIFLMISRPLSSNRVGDIANAFSVEPPELSVRVDRTREISLAADTIELKGLPSSEAMLATVRLRAVCKRVLAAMQTGAKDVVKIDFEEFVPELIASKQQLERERDRLYPIYKFGNVMVYGASGNRP